uniref:Uncharacterized protein n=1 Tax=Bosea sp. NBC_00436 TaxID=2969620 RepID=A0A9E8CM94_9HYPH
MHPGSIPGEASNLKRGYRCAFSQLVPILPPSLFRQVTLRCSFMRRLCGYQTVRLDDDSSDLAWQGIVGLSYPIPAVPGLSLTADYRYFSTASRGVKGTIQQGAISAAGVVGATVATGTLRTRSDYSNQSTMIGLR